MLEGLSGIPFPSIVSLANALGIYGERPLKSQCGMYILG